MRFHSPSIFYLVLITATVQILVNGQNATMSTNFNWTEGRPGNSTRNSSNTNNPAYVESWSYDNRNNSTFLDQQSITRFALLKPDSKSANTSAAAVQWEYDAEGALWYMVVVILMFAIGIGLLIAAQMSYNSQSHDNQINKYLELRNILKDMKILQHIKRKKELITRASRQSVIVPYNLKSSATSNLNDRELLTARASDHGADHRASLAQSESLADSEESIPTTLTTITNLVLHDESDHHGLPVELPAVRNHYRLVDADLHEAV